MPGGDLWGGCLCVPRESGSPALTILATALALCLKFATSHTCRVRHFFASSFGDLVAHLRNDGEVSAGIFGWQPPVALSQYRIRRR